MKCAVHQDVDAVGYCRNCGKPMCSVCVRPVRDVLYCEDCLANIMGLPTPATATATAPTTAPPQMPVAAPIVPSSYGPPAVPLPQPNRASPAVAFILGFFPGLGAVYTGEYNKALIHIVVFVAMIVGLNSDIGAGATVALAILLGGFILYTAFDAMRTAQAKNMGEKPVDAFELWSKNRPVGPMVLIGVGVLFLLSNFDWFSFRYFWPVVLIGVGILMFRNRLGGTS
jgi:hypothetical protein